MSSLPGGRCPRWWLWLVVAPVVGSVLASGLTREVWEPRETVVQLLHQEQSPGSKGPFCSSMEAV